MILFGGVSYAADDHDFRIRVLCIIIPFQEPRVEVGRETCRIPESDAGTCQEELR